MTGRVWFASTVLVFGLAAYVTVHVNGLPHQVATPELQAELAAVLRSGGLVLRTMADAPGTIIDHAVPFGLPGCGAQGFALTTSDAALVGAQAARFTELTGARYVAHPRRMVEDAGILRARLARAIAALRSAAGLPAARNSQIMVTVFMPEGCPAPVPDLQAFWAPAAAGG